MEKTNVTAGRESVATSTADSRWARPDAAVLARPPLALIAPGKELRTGREPGPVRSRTVGIRLDHQRVVSTVALADDRSTFVRLDCGIELIRILRTFQTPHTSYASGLANVTD